MIVLVSLFTAAPPADRIRATIWSRSLVRLPEEELRGVYPRWKQTGLWFTAVVACFIIIYAIIW